MDRAFASPSAFGGRLDDRAQRLAIQAMKSAARARRRRRPIGQWTMQRGERGLPDRAAEDHHAPSM